MKRTATGWVVGLASALSIASVLVFLHQVSDTYFTIKRKASLAQYLTTATHSGEILVHPRFKSYFDPKDRSLRSLLEFAELLELRDVSNALKAVGELSEIIDVSTIESSLMEAPGLQHQLTELSTRRTRLETENKLIQNSLLNLRSRLATLLNLEEGQSEREEDLQGYYSGGLLESLTVIPALPDSELDEKLLLDLLNTGAIRFPGEHLPQSIHLALSELREETASIRSQEEEIARQVDSIDTAERALMEKRDRHLTLALAGVRSQLVSFSKLTPNPDYRSSYELSRALLRHLGIDLPAPI